MENTDAENMSGQTHYRGEADERGASLSKRETDLRNPREDSDASPCGNYSNG